MTERVVCQFSCGAASAIATKMAFIDFGATHEVVAINAFIVEEHEDNRRFLRDIEAWLGIKVVELRDAKYGASAMEVWRRNRYMNGPMGAPCSGQLKRRVLDAWARPDDIMVLGYTAEEQDRFDDFVERNPQLRIDAPLIRHGLTKSDCFALVERAGIELPAMYRLGFPNANCIGCVKGGEGYWNLIRTHFPEVFEAVALLQDELGPGSYFFRDRKTQERYGLRGLKPGKGRVDKLDFSCSFFCEIATQNIRSAD